MVYSNKYLSVLILTMFILTIISPLVQSIYKPSNEPLSKNQNIDPSIITFNQTLALTSIYQGYTDVNGPRSITVFPSYLTGINAEKYWKSNYTRPVLELVGNETQTWYHSSGMVLFNAYYNGNGINIIAYGSYTSGCLSDGYLFSLFITPSSLITKNQSISYWVSEPNLRGEPPEIFNNSPIQGAIPPLLYIQGEPMFPYSPNPYIVVEWDNYGNYMILYYVKYNGTPYNITVIPYTISLTGSINTNPYDIYKLNVSYYPIDNTIIYSVINMNQTNLTYPILNNSTNGIIYGIFNLSSLNVSYSPPSSGRYVFGIEATSGADQGNLGLVFMGNESIYKKEEYYNLTFIENGLPVGSEWSVKVNQTIISSTSNQISFILPAGEYSYSVISASDMFEAYPNSGTLYLNENTTIYISFSHAYHTVTFIEEGLPQGTSWSVNISGHIFSSTSNKISVILPSGQYTYYISSVYSYIQNLIPSSYFIPSPQQGTFYYNNSVNEVINIEFYNAMYVNFQIVVQGNYGQCYTGTLACIYDTNPIQIEVLSYYYNISTGKTIPLNSVEINLLSYNLYAKLEHNDVLTNSQGIAYDNLSLIALTANPVIVPVVISQGLITKELTVVFESYQNQVKTFALCVYNDSSYYNLLFFVNGTSYNSLSNGAEYYISKFTGINCPANHEDYYPIYYVLIYPKGTNIPVNLQRTTYNDNNPYVILLVNTLIWESEYPFLQGLENDWGPNSAMYNLALNDYNNNWHQKIFIYTTYASYYAETLLPLFQTLFGSSADAATDMTNLIDSLIQGNSELINQYGASVANDILKILELNKVIKSPQYTPICLIENFYELNSQQQYQLLANLLSVAYNIQNPNENVIDLGVETMTELAKDIVIKGVVPGVSAALIESTFDALQIREIWGLTLSDTLNAFSQSLEDTFYSSVSDSLTDFIDGEFAEVALPLAIASVLTQNILLPTANLMIQDNKIENIWINYVYPIMFSTFNYMETNGYIANLTDAVLMLQTIEMLQSTWAMWYFTTYKLYKAAILNGKEQEQAPSLLQDGYYCLSNLQETYSSYYNLPTFAINILYGIDPSGLNMSGILGNNNISVKPFLYNYPTQNIVGIVTIGNNTFTEIFYGKYYIIANETGLYGNYPYAIWEKIANLTDIVLFNASRGSLIVYSNNEFTLIPYSFIFNNKTVNIFSKENNINNSLIMINIVNRSNISTIYEGNSTLTFVTDNYTIEINGTVIHISQNKNLTILAPVGHYQYEIISSNILQKGNLSLNNGSHLVITINHGSNMKTSKTSTYLLLLLYVIIIIIILTITIIIISILRRR